ncbi:hypothetical protein F6455_14770 [Proteobacteria bacterium 005FR1]|nr:hypothetical protein [Proteobacteria bacterium 005FR1]
MTNRKEQVNKQPGPEHEQVHHKGDTHSGGGGHAGGGGKQRRPDGGWEKGDRFRDVDDHHTDHEVPGKPGPHSHKRE